MNKPRLTLNELKQLRAEIILNSMLTSDYKNTLGVEPENAQTFFDGWLEDEMISFKENNPKATPKQRDRYFNQVIEKNDINSMYNYYMSIDYDCMPRKMTKDEEKALDLANDHYHHLQSFSNDRAFTYENLTFKPIGNIIGGKNGCCNFTNILKVENYDYYDFYKVAKKHKASCDIFEIDGKLYMPCNNGFVSVIKTNKIKYINDYERWYQ